MLGRDIEKGLLRHDDIKVIGEVKEIFNNCLINIANLEAPFTKSSNKYKRKNPNLSFAVDPDLCNFLNKINISYVTLANNHITDYGIEGIRETISVLKKNKIDYCGVGKDRYEAYKILEICNSPLKIGLLAVTAFTSFVRIASKRNYGVATFDYHILDRILMYNKQYDIIILSIHWGLDYNQYPVPRLLELIYSLIDKYPNLRIIIGHHPHLIQPILKYKNSIIACSLGNFLFDEPFLLSRIGMILSVIINDNLELTYYYNYCKLTNEQHLQYLSNQDILEENKRLNIVYNGILNLQKDYFIMNDKYVINEIKSLFNDFQFIRIIILIHNFGIYNIIRSLIKKIFNKTKI